MKIMRTKENDIPIPIVWCIGFQKKRIGLKNSSASQVMLGSITWRSWFIWTYMMICCPFFTISFWLLVDFLDYPKEHLFDDSLLQIYFEFIACIL